MFIDKRVFFLLLFFYLIDANESEISETTLAQLENKFNDKFIAYEKKIEDLTNNTFENKNMHKYL
jgi:hypothetical protein